MLNFKLQLLISVCNFYLAMWTRGGNDKWQTENLKSSQAKRQTDMARSKKKITLGGSRILKGNAEFACFPLVLLNLVSAAL